MEHSPAFYRLGLLIYKKHKAILGLWIALLLLCLPFLPDLMTPFKTMGFVDRYSNSAKADAFLNKNLGYGDQRIIAIYTSKTLKTDDPRFLEQIKYSLSHIKAFPMPNEIIYPTKDNNQISKNKTTAFAVILFKTKDPLTEENITDIKELIKKPASLTYFLGGEPIFIEDVNNQTRVDLFRADIIAAPVSILIMLLVFGSVIAASIPIVLGACCAIIILTSLYFLAEILNLSIFTINISLLLGLCLSLDYSLFFMSRFKEELHKNLPMEVIIGTTMTSAGRAIFYSGIAVFISLSALLIFPISILFSIGIGGLAAVFFAVIVALVLLPAVLSVVQGKINLYPIRLFKSNKKWHLWRKLASAVVQRPLLFFLPSLIFLLFLSLPFLNAKFGISDAHILPDHSESRKFLEMYKTNFNEHNLSPIQVIATTKNHEDILSKKSLTTLTELTKAIQDNPAVDEVNGIITVDKKTSINDYYKLYHLDKYHRPPALTQLLEVTTGKDFTVLSVHSKHSVHAAQTKQLVKDMQAFTHFKNLNLQVTGIPVNNEEVMERIAELFPFALTWVLVLTYLILLFLLHSLFLPLKAIIMNILSLTASYGALVFVFQEGYLHQFLNFVPQGMLDFSLIMIIFCALFGFSMDYEVFLLTRMKECYETTRQTNMSIIAGIDQSGRIITSAAVIVIVLCGSFMAAEVLMIKEFGLGIAMAIFVDAFLVRSLLVPSIMVFLGKWNWYLPQWMRALLPKAYSIRGTTSSKSESKTKDS